MPTDDLGRELRREVDGEVRFNAGSRAAYSTDASNLRQARTCVVEPGILADHLKDALGRHGLRSHPEGSPP